MRLVHVVVFLTAYFRKLSDEIRGSSRSYSFCFFPSLLVFFLRKSEFSLYTLSLPFGGLFFGFFHSLDFKRMSDVTENYFTRVKDKGEGQYVSLKSVLERSLGPPGWVLKQVSFIAGTRSLNE